MNHAKKRWKRVLKKWKPDPVVSITSFVTQPLIKNITQDATMDATLKWSWDMWKVVVLAQIDHPNEISGYAALDAERRVAWVKVTGLGSMASVITSEAAQSEALLEATERGLVVNVQWHTHYGFEPYFSTTDEMAQKQHRADLPSGDMTFVCFSEFSAVTRRWVWDKSKERYTDGRVWLDGHLLPEGNFYNRWKGVNEQAKLDPTSGVVPASNCNDEEWELDDRRGIWRIVDRDPTPDWNGASYRDTLIWHPDIPPG